MKNMTNAAVAGLISAALMVLAKLLLSQQPQLLAYHYPSFALAGQEGLYKLGLYCAWGAGYGLVYGLVLKMILPGGLFGPSSWAPCPPWSRPWSCPCTTTSRPSRSLGPCSGSSPTGPSTPSACCSF